MAFIAENLILETCEAALATGDVAPLQGTLPGYFTFASKYANGDTCHYLIRGVDVVGRPTGQVETGRGTIIVASGAYGLRRDSVFRSTNADALVAFAAGTKFISVAAVAPATDIARFDWQTALGLDSAGQVAYFAMVTPPPGWLKANGAAISRTAYARLFSRIGTTYGVGDGLTTFNVLDARGEFLRGFDDGRTLDNGRAFGTVQAGGNASHIHGLVDPGHAHGVYDPSHAHSSWTDAQGNHSHVNGVFSNDQENGAVGLSPSGEFAGRVAIVGTNNNFSTSAAGSHSHNVGVGSANTGVSIYAAGTGQYVTAQGIAENRPRNLSVATFIKF